jgi:hypothetical protein
MYFGDFICWNGTRNTTSKRKFCFNVFVNVFQHYSYHKGSKIPWLQCKRLGDIILSLSILMTFCVAMKLQMVENFNKQTEQV